jgi:hypothetical protein
MIPSASAALSFGIISRTTRAPMILSTFTQAWRLKLAMVGLFNAGTRLS